MSLWLLCYVAVAIIAVSLLLGLAVFALVASKLNLFPKDDYSADIY